MCNTNVCASAECDFIPPLGCIIPVTKLRSKKWAVCIASMGDRRGVHRVSVWKLEGKNHWEGLDVVWRIKLKCVFKKLDGEVWIGFIWLRISKGGRLLPVW